MPELPEVETIKRGLSKLIIGQDIKSIESDNPKSFPDNPADVERFVLGHKITAVRRRAKVLIIELDSGYSIIAHLKMTGQLVYDAPGAHFGAGHPNSSLVNKLPDKSTRVIITFYSGGKLFFNDQRKFGWMRVYPTSEIEQIPFFAKAGPEPLDNNFNWQLLKERLSRRPKTAIKPALMDQSVIAGVGNIYADESLWGARIHPARPASSLTDQEYRRLHRSLTDVLKLSIDKGGSTDRNYVDAEGKKGSYLEFANVFRRQGQPCPRCNQALVKTRLAGRGTHYCPHCQKI